MTRSYTPLGVLPSAAPQAPIHTLVVNPHKSIFKSFAKVTVPYFKIRLSKLWSGTGNIFRCLHSYRKMFSSSHGRKCGSLKRSTFAQITLKLVQQTKVSNFCQLVWAHTSQLLIATRRGNVWLHWITWVKLMTVNCYFKVVVNEPFNCKEYWIIRYFMCNLRVPGSTQNLLKCLEVSWVDKNSYYSGVRRLILVEGWVKISCAGKMADQNIFIHNPPSNSEKQTHDNG